VRLEVGPALLRRRHLAPAIGEEAQRPLARDRRIELPHRAGGGIARIDEGLLVLRALGDLLALQLVQRSKSSRRM
jgi:hypothetical protein